MDLSFTEEQQMLREAVRELCTKHADPETVRELEDDPTGYRPEFWRELAQMDLLGLTIPTEYGGSGMTPLEQVVVCEELGRAIAPSPFFVTVGVAANLLVEGGSEDLKQAWLPRIARGEAIVTVAWHEVNASDTPAGLQLTAKDDGDVVRLSGTKIMVPFASAADAVIVLARSGPEDLDLYLVETHEGVDGLSLEQTFTAASDASYELTFDDVTVPVANRIGRAGSGWQVFQAAMDRAFPFAAAYAVGGAERVLEMTVDYAKERVQFGVPIGNFQGVAHPIADIATEIEGAKTLTYEVAWAQAEGRDVGPLGAMAKLFAAETWRRATRVGHQTFGGIGFTLAIDMQLYFRRAKQLQLTWFGPETLSERIAAAELDTTEPWVGIDAGV